MINLGEYNTLRVVRKSDLGYMLTDGTTEILMHFKQAKEELADDAEVRVFIYSDKEKRLTASQIQPYATLSECGFVEVVEVLPEIGIFVNVNTPKDILISKDYLPFSEEAWPMVGDKLFIRLKIKKDFLVGKPLNRYDIKEIKSDVKYEELQSVDAYVCRIAEKGLGLITVDEIYVFVPNHQYRGEYRMGQLVQVTITKDLDGECYGTLNPQKESLMDEDKVIILEFLQKNQGQMRLTSKSSAEQIEKVFKMSRKAFKRAYGSLYKEKKISFDEERTYLV